MDAPAGPHPAPLLGSALGVGEINEGLPGEERAPHEGHLALDSGFVLGRAHPGRIDEEPAGLGVLDEGLVETRLEGIAPSTIAFRLSGISVRKTPPKNLHAASHPAITASVDWRWVSHTKQCRL
jgi:hypothetical protein